MKAQSTSTNPPPPQAFHVMLKPRGPMCNLECSYCFYLRKDALYPNATFRMSFELLEAFTKQYIQAQNVPEITFAWQGGEPTLMGLDFYRKAVDFQRKYRQPGQQINNSLQPTRFYLTMNGASFSSKTISCSVSAWMARGNCTTPTACTKVDSRLLRM
jgi:sulfatase maturation enzyme AslB (radical SAM superfamily)